MKILPSQLRLIIAKFNSMSISDFASKALIRIFKILSRKVEAFIDKFRDTRNRNQSGGLLKLLDTEKIVMAGYSEQAKLVLSKKYMNHKFDLLGSGWVQNTYNNQDQLSFSPIQKLHRPHQKYSFEIYESVSSSYKPIDWQFDFKSGYRWSAKTPSAAIKYGTIKSHDVKVPIELGRLQHLPQLALFALSEKKSESVYVNEVKNQLLDFIAMNPPRFGVNWIFSMDVGIRVVNILLAIDICRGVSSDEIDSEFEAKIKNSVYDHGLHIVNNLEYSKELNSNHYLANIVGLLFVSVYLDSSSETDSWLAFSIQELINEFFNQYYIDGINFEGSSSYHRLSTEMLIYARAIIVGLSEEKLESLQKYSSNSWSVSPKLNRLEDQEFHITSNGIHLPAWFDEKLAKAVHFSYDITKSNGLAWQFGDNDSGRFLKLTPLGMIMDDGLPWTNICLDHSELFSSMSGIIKGFQLPVNSSTIQSIVQNLARGRKTAMPKTNNARANSYNFDKLFNDNELIFRKKIIIDIMPSKSSSKVKLNEGLQYKLYPYGGVLVYKSKILFLGLNCIPNGSNGNGGHSHNDQLSIELQIDDIDISEDPGTYLYTSDPEERNNFRSVKAHNTLRTEQEPNKFFGRGNALFAKENNSRAKFIEIKENKAIMQLMFGGVLQQRSVSIEDYRIVIHDASSHQFENELNTFGRFSSGYGKVEVKVNDLKHILVEYEG